MNFIIKHIWISTNSLPIQEYALFYIEEMMMIPLLALSEKLYCWSLPEDKVWLEDW